MTRRPIVGVSAKMYFSLAHTHSYVDGVRALVGPDLLQKADLFVIPDFVALASVQQQLHGSGIWLGAQDCAADDYGAYTGFVSPAVLRDAGVSLVEIGHAERRRMLGETDATTAAKAAAATRNGLVPLVCVGEVEPPVHGNVQTSIDAVRAQVDAVLSALPDDADVLLAYEPVWAIGAAQPASATHVRTVVRALRTSPLLAQRGGRVRILYGGSAGPGLFAQLSTPGAPSGDDEVDGLFLGRFGHDPAQFVATAREVGGL